MTQYARPASDISNTGWTISGSGNIYMVIGESSYNDSNYIEGVGSQTCEVKLNSVSDPQASTGHTVRVRAYASGSGGAERLTVALYQGTTLIATPISNQSITRGSYNEYSATLTGAQADAISDYADLRLRFTSSTGTGEYIDVSWAVLETPDAAGITLTLGAATLSASPQTLSVDAPIPPTVLTLSAVTLTTGPQSCTASNIIPPVSLTLSAVNLIGSAQTLAVTPGAISRTLTAPTLTAAAQAETTLPGAVTLSLTAPNLSASLPPISSSSTGLSYYEIERKVGAGSFTALAQPAATDSSYIDSDGLVSGTTYTYRIRYVDNGTPGAWSNEAQVTFSIAATQIDLAAAQLSAGAQTAAVQPGPVSPALTAANLTLAAAAQTVLPGSLTHQLQTANLALTAQPVSASSPAPQVVSLTAVNLTAQAASSLILPGAVTLPLNAAQGTTSAQTAAVIPGAASTNLAAASLSAQPQAISANVPAPRIVSLTAVTLSASSASCTVQAGAVSLSLSAATLNLSAQTQAVLPGAVSRTLSTVSLTLSLATLGISAPAPGATVLTLNPVSLASSTAQVAVLPGPINRTLSAANLTTLAQTVTVQKGAVGVALSPAVLQLAAQALLPTGQVQALSTTSLSAQPANLGLSAPLPDPTQLTLTPAVLSLSPRTAAVIPGAVSRILSAPNLITETGNISFSGAVTVSLSAAAISISPRWTASLPGPVALNLTALLLVATACPLQLIAVRPFLGLVNLTLIARGELTAPEYDLQLTVLKRTFILHPTDRT